MATDKGPGFYRLTYSEKNRRAAVYNYGCNFRCRGCAYALKKMKRPERFLDLDEIKSALAALDIDRIHFLGGEPTLNPGLPALLRFCKKELGKVTFLGHTNGSSLPIEFLDGANVGFKAFDENLHIEHTGRPGKPVFENFRRACEAGLEMTANTVLIPGYVDTDQIEKIAGFVADIDRGIPFHITGYIPVPGVGWRRPTDEEVRRAVESAEKRLTGVTFSRLTPGEAADLRRSDPRYEGRRIL